jgi:hypothetical protein
MHVFKSLDEFKTKLKKVGQMEFVQSMRKGDTGIGYTLESLLEIKENNVPLADLGDIELKAYRKNSCSMLTLFTCEPKPAGGERDKMLLKERFHFSDAYLLEGFNFKSFCKLVEHDAVTVDFRMHLRSKGTVRNHGTAFRVHKRRLMECYQTREKLL